MQKKTGEKIVSKGKKGITLISLVITIVVLLILAGISINAVVGDNGIIKKAQESSKLTEEIEAKEIMNRVILEYDLVNSGETLEEFLQTKVPDRIDSVIVNGDGTLTVSKNNYTLTVKDKTSNGSKEDDNKDKQEGELTLSEYSGEYTYPVSGTFSVTKNSGTISVKSSITNIAIAKIEEKNITVIPGTTEGTAIITVTSASNANYKEKSVTYTATVKNGTINLSATAYSGKYDGQAHNMIINVTVDPSDAKIEYSQDGNTYSTIMPTITEATTILVYVRASKIGYKTQMTTCTAQVEVKTFTEDSGVGYYADTDGDGTPDGIIFEDLKKGGSGTWGSLSNNGKYVVSTVSDTKEYYISQLNYEGPFGKKDVISESGTNLKNDRFYVMTLNDYNNGTTYTFANAKGITKEKWSLPSKNEWAAFAGKLEITESNYSTYGLSSYYWTSTVNYSDTSWYINFRKYKIFTMITSSKIPIRLCRTF